MNLWMREMKANRKSLILWCVGMIAMLGASMSKYAGLSSTGQTMNEIMGKMPNSLQAIMGTGTLDLSTVIGYYGITFLYLLLIATIHAGMLGANILSKEERDKTAEFLFVKPISRNQVIRFKLLAALVNIVILNAITWISSIVMVGKSSNGEAIGEDIAFLMIGMFILQLLFLLIGTATAAIFSKKAVAITTGILLLTFILSIVIDLNNNLELLKFVTPFKYFDAKNIINDGGFEFVFVILSVIMIAILSSFTLMLYKKRDLKI